MATTRNHSLLVVGGSLLLGAALLACNGNLGTAGGNSDPDSGVGVQDQGDNSDWDPNYQQTPGSCPSCTTDKEGIGGTPFNTTSNESEFVTQDSDGALVIDKSASKLNRYLWVADTNLPGVVKIDLQTNKIVGRYYTGGASTSRTTVNVLGEAFIGARTSGTTGSYGVTKILPDGLKCPDTNKDGKITTSTGPDDVLAWGQDDCVAWHVNTDGDIRGLAAQDISGIKNTDACKGFSGQKEFKPTEITSQDKHYVWVGGIHGLVYKLDAKTGQILIKTKAPNSVYGMALSGDGKLWVGAGAGAFGFIDTLQCVDQTTCDAAVVCTEICTTTSCPGVCDKAAKTTFSGPDGGYGITVDYKKRVWRSGYPNTLVMRYDPYAPAGTQRLVVNTSASALGGGIAADASGSVWAAHYSASYTTRIDADTMASTTIAAPAKGVAVGSDGTVYAIDYTGIVHIIKPGKSKALTDYTLTKNAVTLKGVAYAYSDMTGVQARLASDEPGWYRKVITPCPYGGEVKWKYLTWDVEAPTGTWAMFNIRAADDAAGLAKASWYTVACITPPGSKGFTSISYIATKLLEIEVRFIGTGDLNDPTSIKSARIKSFSVQHQCVKVD